MKKLKNLLIMFMLVCAAMLISGCDDEASNSNSSIKEDILLESKLDEEAQRTYYQRDITALDGLKAGLLIWISSPDLDNEAYEDAKEYTLTEMLEKDIDDVIHIYMNGYDGELFTEVDSKYIIYGKSEVFRNISADEILIYIENGAVSIYVPVNKEYEDMYSPYMVGTHFLDKK